MHTPKPGTHYAMQVKEECGSHLALTVVTNCTVILCWNNLNINLVVLLTAYHNAARYSAVCTLSSVQELRYQLAGRQCCGWVPATHRAAEHAQELQPQRTVGGL